MADVKKVTPAASITLRRNNKKIYEQFFHPDATDYGDNVAQSFTLATNSNQLLEQGTISVIRQLLIESSGAIEVRYDGATNGDPGPSLTAGGAVFYSACSIASVRLYNLSTSTTGAVDVTYALTD